jgi:hypothetical protein
MPVEAARRSVPDSYSTMYPSRFLRADMLKGKKITLTIKSIFGEDLLSSEEEAAKPEWIFQFLERPIEWVCNKSNAYCMFRMWGGDPRSWVGKRVTLFGQPGMWFGEKGEAIRVWGSPDLAEDLPITLRFLRKKKDRNMVMHRTETKAAGQAVSDPEPAPVQTAKLTPTPRMLEIFPLLGWGPDVCDRWLTANANSTQADAESKLEAELEK